MSLTPRVTFGVPVYNGENFLEEALVSLLAQDYGDFELIISDNASWDKTEEICRRYAARDERIRYYRSANNRGAVWNYNRLVTLARGEFFRWAAHDDVVAPSYLRRCVETFDRSPDNVVLCCPKTTRIDANGNTLEDRDDELDLRMKEPHERLRRVLENPGYWSTVFGLIRLEDLRRTRLMGNYWVSDRVLLGELSLRGEFRTIPERLFFRRYHAGTCYRANHTLDELATWLDPANKGKQRNVFFALRLFYEYMRAIRASSLTLPAKLRCYGVTIEHWAVEWRAIAGDVKRALKLSTDHVQ